MAQAIQLSLSRLLRQCAHQALDPTFDFLRLWHSLLVWTTEPSDEKCTTVMSSMGCCNDNHPRVRNENAEDYCEPNRNVESPIHVSITQHKRCTNHDLMTISNREY